MEKYFEMSFVGHEVPELWKTCFEHPAIVEPKKVVRGKSGGAFISFGSFQWTKAVKALALLMLRSVHHAMSRTTAPVPVLIGGGQSLASSLDYALDKHPLWLIDMFGIDSYGNPLIRRILKRTNPGRKRIGPTAVALNNHFLPLEVCTVKWDDKPLTTPEEILSLIEAINWEDGSSGKSQQKESYTATIERAAALGE